MATKIEGKEDVLLTAAEARRLAGPSVMDRVREALVTVRRHAEAGKHRVDLTSQFWVEEGMAQTEDWLDAKALLEQRLGYKVEFVRKTTPTGVDMHTSISWEEVPNEPKNPKDPKEPA